jgi:cell filamentation protein, protein adenylyltransferase
MSDDPYLYPATTILRNRLGIRNAEQLEAFERLMAMQRAAEGIPTGDFDLAHLQAIHGHLFQDVYDWAGQIRTVESTRAGINSCSASISKPAWPTFIEGSLRRII